MWDEHTTRNPMLLLRLFGWLLLRLSARALSCLLFQEPPRTTRDSIAGRPTGFPMCIGYRTRRLHVDKIVPPRCARPSDQRTRVQ